jgi:hypothetical protein
MTDILTADQARARAPIAAMTGLVDQRAWGALRDCFADTVLVDYTSLWGGEPQEMSGDALIEQWRNMLPSFDATQHELGPVAVDVRGNQAEATAPVKGTHILGGQSWIVEGHYKVELQRSEGHWRIQALQYANERETGDRGLTEQAKTRAPKAG